MSKWVFGFVLFGAVACGGAGGPGPDGLPDPGGGPESSGRGAEAKIPSDYPQLNARYSSHAVWRLDGSGAEIVPNQWTASVDDLPRTEAAETFGAIYDPSYRSYYLKFSAPSESKSIEIYVPTLDPGGYEVTGFGGELVYTERESYRYTTSIGGGRGTVTIAGTDGIAIWGTFEVRTCFVETPNANCWSIYRGRFSALDQRPEGEVSGGSGPPR